MKESLTIMTTVTSSEELSPWSTSPRGNPPACPPQPAERHRQSQQVPLEASQRHHEASQPRRRQPPNPVHPPGSNHEPTHHQHQADGHRSKASNLHHSSTKHGKTASSDSSKGILGNGDAIPLEPNPASASVPKATGSSSHLERSTGNDSNSLSHSSMEGKALKEQVSISAGDDLPAVSEGQADDGGVTDPGRSGDAVRGRKKGKRKKKVVKMTEDSGPCSPPPEESLHFRDEDHSQSLLRLSEDACYFHWWHVLHTKCARLVSTSFGPWCGQVTSSGQKHGDYPETVASHPCKETSGSSHRDKAVLETDSQNCSTKNGLLREKTLLNGGAKEGGNAPSKEKHPKNCDVFDRLSGQAPPYVFHHAGDVRSYMSEYRERYTVGNVCRKTKRYPVLGVDLPDPYFSRKKKPCACIECSPLNHSKMAAAISHREGASVQSGDSSGSGKDNSSAATRTVPNLAPVRQQRAAAKERRSLSTTVAPPPPPPPPPAPTPAPPESPRPDSDPSSVPATALPSLHPQQQPQRGTDHSLSLRPQPEPRQPTLIGQFRGLQQDQRELTLIGQSPGSNGPIGGSQTTLLNACSLSSLDEQKVAASETTDGKSDGKSKKKGKKGHLRKRRAGRPPVADATEMTSESHVTSRQGSETSQPITISVPMPLKRLDREEESESRKESWLPGIARKNDGEKRGRKEVKRDGFLNITVAQRIYETKVTLSRPMNHDRRSHPQNTTHQKLSRAKRSRSVDFLAGGNDVKSKSWKNSSKKGGFLNVKVMSVNDLPAVVDAEKGNDAHAGWRSHRNAFLPRILDPLASTEHVPRAVGEECWGQAHVEADIPQHERQSMPTHPFTETGGTTPQREKPNTDRNMIQESGLLANFLCSGQLDIELETGSTSTTESHTDSLTSSRHQPKHLTYHTPRSERSKHIADSLSNKNRSSASYTNAVATTTITPTTTTTTSDSAQDRNAMGIRGRTMLLDPGHFPESEGMKEEETPTTMNTTATTTKELSLKAQIPPLKSDLTTKQSRCFPAKHFKRLSTYHKPPAALPGKDGVFPKEEKKGRAGRRASNEDRIPLSTIDPTSLIVKGGTLLTDGVPQEVRKQQKGKEKGQGRELDSGQNDGDDALSLSVAFRLPKEAVSSLDRKENVTAVR